MHGEAIVSLYLLSCKTLPKTQFSGVKLTSNTGFYNCTLSNSTVRLKILEVIASINLKSAGQITSYAGKLSLILFTPLT